MPPAKTISINCEFHRVFTVFENADSRTIIGCAKPSDDDAAKIDDEKIEKDGTIRLKGDDNEAELVVGLSYRFYGKWDNHHKHGWQFVFRQFVKIEPHSRVGVARYLARYAPGIGSTLANRLFDAFGTDACKVLRNDPASAVAAVKGLKFEVAQAAGRALAEIVELEDTKIELTNLFSGRGFPGSLIDTVIKRWGILAPKRIARDPFTLLVNDLPGCGFSRCDRLYLDLGLNPARLKRQAICAWHVLHSDSSGHTWFPYDKVSQGLLQLIGGAKVETKRAMKLAIRAGWLSSKKDASGAWWFAEAQKAMNETRLAERIRELQEWNQTLKIEHEPSGLTSEELSDSPIISATA